jgi:hypothetical protein
VPVPARSDIAFTASVSAERLRFAEPPDTKVTFHGSPGRTSVSASERTNLPERVEERVEYRDARVRYALASRLRTDADTATYLSGDAGTERDTGTETEAESETEAETEAGAGKETEPGTEAGAGTASTVNRDTIVSGDTEAEYDEGRTDRDG